MQIKNREQTAEYLYLAYFIIMTGTRALGMYAGTLPYTIILVTSMCIFLCKMLVTKHSLTEYALAACLLGAAGIVYLHTGEKGLIVCFATILGMKGVDRYKVIKCGAVTAAVCICIRVIPAVFGLISEKYYMQTRDGVGTMVRHGLGYVHPNTLHMNVLMLSLLIIYLMTRWLRSMDRGPVWILGVTYVLIFCFNLYIYRYSGSRTGVLAVTAYIMINTWFFIRRTPGLPEKIVCWAFYPFACILAIVVPLVLPDRIFELVDSKIFTTRFTIARYFWSNNHVSLFGIRLNNPDPDYLRYGIDMSHLYLFLQLGIVAFILISILTLIFVYGSLKRADMPELAVLLGVLFSGIWEPYLYNLGFKNFTYVFMGALFYEMLGTPMKEHVFRLMPPDKRKLMSALTAGVLCGMIAAGGYSLISKTPAQMFADNGEDENRESLGLQEYYFTVDEIDSIRRNGDIVIGYSGKSAPMYEYGSDIAIKEYKNRILSIGVWMGLAGMGGMLLIIFLKARKGMGDGDS